MKTLKRTSGIEINPKFVGAFFTEQTENKLRVFCFFTNGGTSQFDLPVDENLENLQSFHSKLNMDETCSSVILDEMVQGRVYVHAEDTCWLYTLLSTPGDVLPPINGDICDFPWRHCWRSQAVDILEYGKPGDSVHCFAVRTQISENDASRLVKDAKAFINPITLQKKKPIRQVLLAVGATLALAAAIAASMALHALRHLETVTFNPTVSVAQATADSYYLLYHHQITGPYPSKTIANLKAGGLLASETLCRSEKSTEWAGLATLFPPQLSK